MEKTETGGRTDAAVWQPVKGLPSVTKSCAAASCFVDSSSLAFRFPILFFAWHVLHCVDVVPAECRFWHPPCGARPGAACSQNKPGHEQQQQGSSLPVGPLPFLNFLHRGQGTAVGAIQDHVVEWLQYVCGPRTPDTRRICAHRERETSQSHRSILRGNGREDAHGCHQDVRTAPHHRREARAPRARPTSLVINRVQSTTLIASRCGGQVVQMHSWGAGASRPSGGVIKPEAEQ